MKHKVKKKIEQEDKKIKKMRIGIKVKNKNKF
jgi:hypothetical protein